MPSISKMMGFGLAPQVAGAVTGDVVINLTATGSTQATALALSANHNLLTTVAAATGVVLPAISSPPGLGVSNGDQITVYNNGANTVNVYPPLGSTIGLAAVNTAVTIVTGKSSRFTMLTPTIWGVVASA